METITGLDAASLCVDGRAFRDFAGRAAGTQDVIEGLSNHVFAEDGPLVLAHPQQDLAAPFRRANTRHRTGGAWFSPSWERRFVASRHIGWFHRFLPIDKIHHAGKCSLITTLLPALRRPPFFLSRRNGHHFVVPCLADLDWVQRTYGVPPSQVTFILPAPRRSVLQPPAFHVSGERGVVVIRDGRKDGFERHVSIIRRCFPHTRLVTVDLRDAEATGSDRWLRSLQNAMACFYLVEARCDWVTLALESIYWEIPTFFADGNRTLSELFPIPAMQLHSFLANAPSPAELSEMASQARERLDTIGVLEQDQQAIAYRELYLKLGALGLS